MRPEGQKVGTEEREHGNGAGGHSRDEKEPEQEKRTEDPLLSLPINKGKYAKPEKHFINIEV